MNMRGPIEIYRGTHRGIDVEINHFKMGVLFADETDCWTYYLIIPLASLPEKMKKLFWLKPNKDNAFGRVGFNYYGSDLLTAIDFHGGITYYERKFDEMGKPWRVKIGCDFQHLGDEGRRYNLEYVQSEAEQSVDSLIALIPDRLVRCSWNGKYYPLNKVVVQTGGSYRSVESIEKENNKKEI